MDLEMLTGTILRTHIPGVQSISVFGLLLLIINIVATVSVVRGRLALVAKVLWLLAIWFLPLIGAILYALLGRTRRH